MKHILFFFWVTGLVWAGAFVATAEAKTRFEIKQMVINEAQTSDVPVSLALAVAKVESDFNEKALSSAGARGVMQIMPATAQLEFGVHPDDLWSADKNIRLGLRFLERLYDQYDGKWGLALSHYNGGTLKNKRAHTFNQRYVQQVQKWQQVYFEQASLWSAPEEEDAVQLTEWTVRDIADEEDPFFDEGGDQEEEDWRRPQVIVVEREPDFRGWHRPLPPPARPFGRREGHPRHLR